MANKSISQLNAAALVNNGDLFETAQPDLSSASGYTSAKQSMAAIADHIATQVVYPSLGTTAQTLVGALNELEAGGGGGANYSTTEHVVGTWVDGSPLYEKTFVWTWADAQSGSASGGRTQGEFDTTFGDEIDMIWIDFGNSYLKFTGTNAENASIVSQPLTYATSGGGYTRINIQRKPSMNNNKMFCWFDCTYPTDVAADTSKWKWIVTFRYTKSAS